MISTSNLSIGYARKVLATDVNIALHSGELTCLLGPNGAGKSTLINTLAGYLQPLSGDVIISGQKLQQMPVSQRAQQVSVVLTDRIQVNNMTVTDIVAMGRSPYTGFFGKLSEDDIRIVSESLQMVGMTEFSERQFMSLSDGEKQKVLIAKAIAQQTPVIILDEPTAFLDYPSKIRMLLLLRRLAHQTGKAILLSTHDMEQSLTLADRLWLMSSQQNITTGTVEELSNNGAISACFDCEEMKYNALQKRFELNTDIEK